MGVKLIGGTASRKPFKHGIMRVPISQINLKFIIEFKSGLRLEDISWEVGDMRPVPPVRLSKNLPKK